VIDRATAVRALMQQTELRALVNSLGQLPSAPRIYHRLVALLEGDRGELAEVAGLLEEDPALAAKVLQVVNSAFFGLPQRIANVGQAITYLGTEMVKALVLSVEAGSALGAAPRTTGIDMDGLRRRDLTAARLCRKLLPDKAQADAAFTAALLQNVGLAILAARRSEALEGLLAEARATGRPIVEAERSALGTTHPELGAFLLGVWGLPMDVVNAVLHHQTPGGLSATRLDASGAVHVAAALVGEASPGGREDPLVPKLDAAYLAQVGATGQIEGWRGLARALVEGARA
jgi:HD-like signal output (HDOD) protein